MKAVERMRAKLRICWAVWRGERCERPSWLRRAASMVAVEVERRLGAGVGGGLGGIKGG